MSPRFQDVTLKGNLSPSDVSRILNDLVPKPDNDQDLGKTAERWRDGFFGRNLTVDGTATFNGPLNVLGGGTLLASSRLVDTTAPLAGGGDLSADRTLSISASSAGTDGYLSSADWTTFNAKASLTAAVDQTFQPTADKSIWFKQANVANSADIGGFKLKDDTKALYVTSAGAVKSDIAGPLSFEGSVGACSPSGGNLGKLCWSSTGNRLVWGYNVGSNTNILLASDTTVPQLTPTDNTVPVGSGSVWESKAIPDCPDSAGKHLNYDAATNTFTCGTS